MLRYLLSAYLSLALAAGPALCCCTVSGLTSLFSGNWLIGACCKHSHDPADGHQHGSKHLHHDSASHSSGSHTQDEKSSPSPTHRKCPCSQHDSCRVGAAELLINSASSSVRAWPNDSVGSHFLPRAGHKGAAQSIPTCLCRGQDDQFLWDGGDILRACSMLRC